MPTATLLKFNYPESLIKTYQYWHLLLRPQQPTLGALVLVCKESVTQYSNISPEAIAEQKEVMNDIESILKKRFNYDKINYLMLMMVDPAVHFHILPRYQSDVDFCNQNYPDIAWPKPANLSHDLSLRPEIHQELLNTLKLDFSQHSAITPSTKKYRRMYTSGCFDIFHQGHLNILKKTKELCDYLIVGVSTDELIMESKGRPPLIPFEERISILESNRFVDEVIPQINKNKQYIVDMYHLDAISVGSDWKGKYPEVSCDMVYFDYTPNVSSTVLKQKLSV